jgi:hypothetical protein
LRLNFRKNNLRMLGADGVTRHASLMQARLFRDVCNFVNCQLFRHEGLSYDEGKWGWLLANSFERFIVVTPKFGNKRNLICCADSNTRFGPTPRFLQISTNGAQVGSQGHVVSVI